MIPELTPQQLEMLKWAGTGVAAAFGWAGVRVKRQATTWLKHRRHEKTHIASVREDNERFKSEVRAGLEELRHGGRTMTTAIRRIDAELRAQMQADERPIMQTCDDGHVDAVNIAFTREFGWTLEQMEGLGWITNAIAGMDQRRIREQWTAAVENGDFLQTEAVVVRRDGSMAGLCSIVAHPKKCADNSKFGWQLVLRVKKPS